MHPVTEDVKKDVHTFKPFLLRLYGATTKYQKNKILSSASEKELSLLIRILHYLTHKEIPIAKSRKEEVLKTRRLPYIVKHFKADASVTKLLGSNTKEQLQILKQVGLFEHILHAMFSED
jgi:hypothetical protein